MIKGKYERVVVRMKKKIENMLNKELKDAMLSANSQDNTCEMIEKTKEKIEEIVNKSKDKKKMMLAIQAAIKASYSEGNAGIVSNEAMIFASCSTVLLSFVTIYVNPDWKAGIIFNCIFILSAVTVFITWIFFLYTSIKLKRDLESSKLEYLIKQTAVNECMKEYGL